MDSSPDLSLKLRRGSSDSRDSFYMDFAQGIDSDIEEVTTIGPPTIIERASSGDDAVDEDEDVKEEEEQQQQPPPAPPPPLPLDDG